MGHKYKIDPDLCGKCGIRDAEHRKPPEYDRWYCPHEEPIKNQSTAKDNNAKA